MSYPSAIGLYTQNGLLKRVHKVSFSFEKSRKKTPTKPFWAEIALDQL